MRITPFKINVLSIVAWLLCCLNAFKLGADMEVAFSEHLRVIHSVYGTIANGITTLAIVVIMVSMFMMLSSLKKDDAGADGI